MMGRGTRMKGTAFWISALALPLLAQQDIPDHPDKLKFPKLEFKVPDARKHRVELRCGAVAYLAEDHSLPIVEMEIRFRGGSFWDPKGREGAASMAGALMRTGGAGDLSPEALDEEIDFIAAQISTSFGDTSGVATLSVLTKNLDRGLELLGLILKSPRFDEKKLAILRARVIQELKARNDSTSSIERREANLLFYGDYPVNRLPTKASVEAITREDLRNIHRRFVHPGHFFIAAAGDFDRKAFAEKLDALFADWPFKAEKVPQIPRLQYTPKPGVYVVHKEGKNINQGRVTIGHLGITLDHPDLQKIRVMNYIYGGGGLTSRLGKVVRAREGLAYSVWSSYSPGIHYPGLFAIRFQSKNESCLYAAKLCLEELQKMKEAPPPKEVVEEAIQFYLQGFPGFFFSSPFHTMQTFARSEMEGYPEDYWTTWRERLKEVTPENVQAVARKYCSPEKFVFLFVGNIPEIRKGDGKTGVRLEDFGKVTEIPLPDPLTLKRP